MKKHTLKRFKKIVNINPGLIMKDLDFYFKWLSLSEQNSFDYLKQNLMINEKLKNMKKAKHLFLNFLWKITKNKYL